MNRLIRLILVLFLLAALLPIRQAAAQDGTSCAGVAEQLQSSYKEGVVKGAKYCVIYPPGKLWNRDLVVFAHGYVFADPLDPFKQPDIPWDQAIRGELNLPGILVKMGYAFAISAYHKDGLAVKEGVQDTVNLVQYLRKTNHKVNRVFITGASEGGLVTTQALEQYPALFSGGLSTCGPIGDFQKQVDYWGNFRVLFDMAFPFALRHPDRSPVTLPYPPSTPVYIDPVVIQGWGTDAEPGLVAQAVGAMVQQPGAADAVDALLLQSGAPYDPADPSTKLATVAGLLSYNVMATDEARWELSGSPPVAPDVLYGTLEATNTGNPLTYTELVNGEPVTTQADPAALEEIQGHYQTSGKLPRPLVVMHTTGDPIVPFWHAELYLVKALKAGSLGKLTLIPISRYGHCAFTPAEAVFGFYVMVLRSTLQPFTDTQIRQALPDAAARQEFQALKQKGAGK